MRMVETVLPDAIDPSVVTLGTVRWQSSSFKQVTRHTKCNCHLRISAVYNSLCLRRTDRMVLFTPHLPSDTVSMPSTDTNHA